MYRVCQKGRRFRFRAGRHYYVGQFFAVVDSVGGVSSVRIYTSDRVLTLLHGPATLQLGLRRRRHPLD